MLQWWVKPSSRNVNCKKKIKLSFFGFFCLFCFGFWPCSLHVEVSRPGSEPMPQQWPEPLQWQHGILNVLCQKGNLKKNCFNLRAVWQYQKPLKSFWTFNFTSKNISQEIIRQIGNVEGAKLFTEASFSC